MADSLPAVFEHECALLGSLMIDNALMDVAADKLVSLSAFSDHRTLAVWQACTECYGADEPIELLSVQVHLRSAGKMPPLGTPAKDDQIDISFITGLFESVATTASFDYYLTSVVNAARHRKLILWTSHAREVALQGSANADTLFDELLEITNDTASEESRDRTISDIVAARVELAKERKVVKDQDPWAIFGIPTGYFLIDYVTGCLQTKEISFLGAAPGIGKTAFGINLAENAADAGFPTHIFSMEMPSEQIGNRFIAAGANINSMKIRQGDIDDLDIYQLDTYYAKIKGKNLPLVIDDTSAMTIAQLRSRMRRSVRRYGTKLFILDYLQLVEGTNRLSRVVEIGEVCKGLKDIAKELDVHIFAIAAINRLAATRKDHRPIMSDLRESGSAEYTADNIFFLHRNLAWMAKDEVAIEEIGDDMETAEFIIAKNRNGEVGMVRLGWKPSLSKFVNLEMKATAEEYVASKNYHEPEEIPIEPFVEVPQEEMDDLFN